MSVSVSVVIPTLGRPQLVARCVEAILGGEWKPEAVIVCDQSRDERTRQAIERISKRDERVRYQHLDVPNASAARNAGAYSAQSELVAFIDDDCIADTRWLAELVRSYTITTAGGERVGLVSGRILPLGSSTGAGVSARTSKRRKCFRAAEGGLERGEWAPWDAASGASLLVPRDLFVQIGAFDETLGPGTPTYAAEDIDLVYRLSKMGTLIYEPSAIIYHAEVGHRRRVLSRFRYGAGMGYFLRKHIRRGDRTARRLLLTYARLRVYLLLRSRPGRVPERLLVLIGLAWGLRGLGTKDEGRRTKAARRKSKIE